MSIELPKELTIIYLDFHARPTEFILADHVRAWLEKAPVVYGAPGYPDGDGGLGLWGDADSSGDIDGEEYEDTHTARLVCVSEIRKDTAESLLREYLAHSDKGAVDHILGCDLAKRARKLLGGADE